MATFPVGSRPGHTDNISYPCDRGGGGCVHVRGVCYLGHQRQLQYTVSTVEQCQPFALMGLAAPDHA